MKKQMRRHKKAFFTLNQTHKKIKKPFKNKNILYINVIYYRTKNEKNAR